MFSKNRKSFLVRFVLILTLLAGAFRTGNVHAAPLGIGDTVLVTAQDTDGIPVLGLNVYAFNGTTYAGIHGTTDPNGQVSLQLPEGVYRFRADLNGTQFWSGASNHCEVPSCDSASITVSKPMMVTVIDTDNAPKAGLNVYAFNGSTYAGYNKVTNADGQAFFTLPLGSYRFRADLNGTQFWSGTSNHCDIPGCASASITVSKPMTVTVLDTDDTPKSGLNVYAFNGSIYAGYNKVTNADGQAVFTLPLGSYRFRADLNGTQFWSGTANHCDIPDCDNVGVTVSKPMTLTIVDTENTPKAGLNVYAFNGSTYTGYSKTTDTSGQAVFTLPLGNYRFRADLNGTQFWSGTSNHCTLPGCESTQVSVTIPITVTIQDGGGMPKSSVNVYAFNGSTYAGYSKVSDANGRAIFTLPLGNYRFRADYSGIQYWSASVNHCTLPGCSNALVTVGPAMTATETVTLSPTPMYTPTATQTYTPTSTNTPTFPPTYTPTITATPVLGCNSIRDTIQATASPIKFSGTTMYLDIPNANSYPVTIRNVYVAWNYDKGHVGANSNLRLLRAQLDSNVFWTGNVHAPNYTIPLSTAVVIPANGTSRLTFTFDQTYNRRAGEQIVIQFSTSGCENYPVIVPAGTSTATPVPSANLKAQLISDGTDNNVWTQFRYRVQNTGTNVASNITVRIYFTIDASNPASNYALEKYYDQSGVATVTGPTLVSGNTYYFTINYGAASLAAGNSWEFDTSLHLNDWAITYNSTNDWWHTTGALPATWTDWENIMVYVNGSRVWGVLP